MASISSTSEFVPSALIPESNFQGKGHLRGHFQAFEDIGAALRPIPARNRMGRSASSYSTRVSDERDFAFHWEAKLVPILAECLPGLLGGTFSVDVHASSNEGSSDPTHHLIITSPSTVSSSTEEVISRVIVGVLPSQLCSIKLEFCWGIIELCNDYLGTSPSARDKCCPPKRAGYMACPGLGVSIGEPDDFDSASLGGFIRIGGRKAATTTRHQHEKSLDSSQSPVLVQHPSKLDLFLYQEAGSDIDGPQTLGSISYDSGAKSFRPSLVFTGTSQEKSLTLVEMDWAVIDIRGPGLNIVPVPSFKHPQEAHAVTDFTDIRGTTEVYGVGRTSGYSQGYTSDVPGLQYFNSRFHREWTVRQYSPSFSTVEQSPSDSSETSCSNLGYQSTKEWVTGGIGVPGDSGAWLMTREHNQVVGHVWARKTSYGPATAHRLTYFTPFVDLKADIEDKTQMIMTLPTIQPGDLAVGPRPVNPHPALGLFRDEMDDPWNAMSSNVLSDRRVESQTLIEIIGSDTWDPSVARSPSGRELIRQLAQAGKHGERLSATNLLTRAPGNQTNSGQSVLPSWTTGSSIVSDSNDTVLESLPRHSPDAMVTIESSISPFQEKMANQLRRAKAIPTSEELGLVKAMMALSQAACTVL